MKDEDRKRLTGFMGKCWHEIERPESEPTVFHQPCLHCGRMIYVIRDKPVDQSSTFSTEADMTALYRRLHEVGKWEKFERHIYWTNYHDLETDFGFTEWLFCLSGEKYEERCQMVDSFLEEREDGM